MHPNINPTTYVFLLLFPIILSFPAVYSDPRATQAGNLTCGRARATTTTLIPTFVQAMERLSSNLNNSDTNFAVAPNTTSSFYALIQCHRDLSRTDCLVCYAVSRTTVPGCLPATSGRIFLDGCFVRYDNYSFFQEAVDPATDAKNCSSSVVDNNNINDFQGGVLEFNKSVTELVDNLTRLAVNNSGFGVLEGNRVYGLAQCWESLSSEECRVCLAKARTEAISCLPSREGRSMNAGCFLRYSTQKFFNNDQDSDGGSSGISLHPFFFVQDYDCVFGSSSFFPPKEFFENNIRTKADLDAFGALGDAGWYCIGVILWAMNYKPPTTVTALPATTHNSKGVIMSTTAALHWEQEGTTATFYCSFLSHETMDVSVLGSNGSFHVEDLIIPYEESSASFNFTSGAAFVDLHIGWNMKEQEVQVQNELPQEALMVKEFSRLVKGIKDFKIRPDKMWGEISRTSQVVLDAVKSSVDSGKMVYI